MHTGIEDYIGLTLSGDFDKDTKRIEDILKNDSILFKRLIKIGHTGVRCKLYYIDGMVNASLIDDSVIRPLVSTDINDKKLANADFLLSNILFTSDAKTQTDLGELLRSLLYGDTVIILENSKIAILIDSKGWRTRGVSEPVDERVLQGPREGFDEAAMLNMALIRRKLVTPDLCTEMLHVGRRSGTLVFLCYLGSLANKKTVDFVRKKIKEISIDGILDSNYISEIIKQPKYCLFKTIGTTERPDIVAARLLEGRIAVVVDGTPVVLTIPYLFCENFQSDEDYYLNFLVSSVGRILRYICFFLAVSVPAVFVALCVHHFDLLPTSFAVTLIRLRGGVPFPSVIECLLLIFVFEILKETGVRMPQSLGHALSIVGGLVVGQASVEAGIISAPMLIAVALSGIAGLMIPRLKGAVIYIKVGLVLAASFFGLYGVFALSLILILRVLSLNSFGTDYTLPLLNPTPQGLKDTFIRAPWGNMLTRPTFNLNRIRKERKND
ncbi:MAG: spore germination protein [Clostridia bacterium]|nr:spore germination protein [Clostridia bacterium]